MKRKTATQRNQEVIREYTRRYPGAFLVADIVAWAMERGLMPVPGRLTVEIDAATEWDELFSQIRSEAVTEGGAA